MRAFVLRESCSIFTTIRETCSIFTTIQRVMFDIHNDFERHVRYSQQFRETCSIFTTIQRDMFDILNDLESHVRYSQRFGETMFDILNDVESHVRYSQRFRESCSIFSTIQRVMFDIHNIYIRDFSKRKEFHNIKVPESSQTPFSFFFFLLFRETVNLIQVTFQ